MTALVLDSEAISQLARRHSGGARGVVHAALTVATASGAEVFVPAAVLAEQYRGGRHDQALDACLARYPGIQVADTTRSLAKRIGNLLARAGRGSADHVDAAVVAVAAGVRSAVILTSDPDDLTAIAGSLPGLAIRSL